MGWDGMGWDGMGWDGMGWIVIALSRLRAEGNNKTTRLKV